jgi:hypothetical protein
MDEGTSNNSKGRMNTIKLKNPVITREEQRLYQDAFKLIEQIEVSTRAEADEKGLLTQLDLIFTEMKEYPALTQVLRIGLECYQEWLNDNPVVSVLPQ